MGEESCPAAKKMPISRTRKIPLTNTSLFIAVVFAVVSFVLTSDFMYRYFMLILISQGLLILICSMTKALNDQNSSKQNSQTLSPPFNATWKTLLQLLLVLSLINLLIVY